MLSTLSTFAFPTRDSQEFAHTFSGIQIWNSGFINGWSEDNGSGTTESLDYSILNYDHSSSTAATVLNGTGAESSTWPSNCAGDWSCEFKLRFNNIPNGFALWIGTGTRRIIIEIYADRTQDSGADSFNIAHINNDGNFHRFRVVHDSSSGLYYLWRDSELLTPAGAPYDTVATDNRFLLGDYTKNSFGDFFNVDIAWIRFDQSGAFAPATEPDPSSLYAWYRADDGVVQSDSSIIRWENQATSTNAASRHLDRVERRPQKIRLETDHGQRSAIRFAGNEGIWRDATDFGSLDTARTLIFALRINNDEDGFLFDGTTNIGMTRSQVRNKMWQVGIQPPPIENASNPDPVTDSSETGSWQVHTFSFNRITTGTIIKHFLDGEHLSTSTNSNTAPLSGLILGMNAAASMGLNVDIAEALIYDYILPESSRSEAEGYLAERWLSATNPEMFFRVVRRRGDDSVNTYRIPALATATNGAVIAVFDMRWNSSGDLPGNIDVGMCRSLDNGDTWEPMQTIMDMGSDPAYNYDGVGDPCILVDSVTGRIWVGALWSHGNNAWNGSGPGLTPEETGQFVLVYSDDNGESWSNPVNITPQIKDPSWNLLLQGPGKGFTSRNGTLVMPAQYKDGSAVPRSCFITSTDHGSTWKISNPAVPSGSPATTESQSVELNNGDYMISMRNHAGLGKRAWATSSDGGTNWSAVSYLNPDPTCQASFIRYSSTLDGAPDNILLFSNPANASSRVYMTIRMSTDEGKTWSYSRLLDTRYGAYSCMSVLQDGSIGILYETGDNSAYETLTFARFTISWLLGHEYPPNKSTVILIN